MEFINSISRNGLENTIRRYKPSLFVSLHIFKDRKTNLLIILLGTFAVILITFINAFRKKKPILKNYHTLIYVPNEKYTRFITAFIQVYKKNYLIISDSKLSIDSITLNEASSFSRYHFFTMFLSNYAKLLKTCYRKGDLSKLKQFYWATLSILRREVLLESIFSKVKFENYFSLHPIDSFHSLIEVEFKKQFRSTYAIRPTTTGCSLENKFYFCDNLFYKSQEELDIYKSMCNPEINFLHGGLMYPDLKYHIKNRYFKQWLFFDTCTSKDEIRNQCRIDNIKTLLDFAKLNGVLVYFKFHPGLLEKEKQQTVLLLSKYSNVTVINNEIPWDIIDLSVGFSSTIFFDSILRGIPVYDIVQSFCFLDDLMSTYKINDVSDYKKILEFYSNRELIIQDQYKWLCNKYNYPNGLLNMSAILSK